MANPKDYTHEKFEDEWAYAHEEPEAQKREDETRDRKWLALAKTVWDTPTLHTDLKALDVAEEANGGPLSDTTAAPLRLKRDNLLANVGLMQKHVKNTGPNTPQQWGDPDTVEIWVVDDPARVPPDYDPDYHPKATNPSKKKPKRLYRVIPPPPAAANKDLALLALPGYIQQMRKMYGALTGAV